MVSWLKTFRRQSRGQIGPHLNNRLQRERRFKLLQIHQELAICFPNTAVQSLTVMTMRYLHGFVSTVQTIQLIMDQRYGLSI